MNDLDSLSIMVHLSNMPADPTEISYQHNPTISVEEAWVTFQSDDALKAKFQQHLTTFGLNFDISLNPYWALWYARFVIADEWLMGEALMFKDEKVWAWYTAYTDIMREFGALGRATKVSAKYRVNDRGQITADLREDKQPLLPTKKVKKRDSSYDVADRISKQMEGFQKQRKQASKAEG